MNGANNHFILRSGRVAILAGLCAVLTSTGCASNGTAEIASPQPQQQVSQPVHHAGHHGGGQAAPPSANLPEMSREELEAYWGIELIDIQRTAANFFLRFRYRVIDAEKATPLLQRKYASNPHLIVEKNGAKLDVPFSRKIGTLRQSVRTANQIKPGKNYFALFANPGQYVESGDMVTVVIGDFRAPNIVVR